MDSDKPKSPRELNGLPERPGKSDMPLTESEAARITSALANPSKTLKDIEKRKPKTLNLSVLVASKLGDNLVEAGVDNKKLAKVIHDSLDATKWTPVGKGKYKEIPDHKLRLTGWHLAMRSAGADAPVPEGDKAPSGASMGALLAGMGIGAIENMRKEIIETRRQLEIAAGARIETVVADDEENPAARTS